MENAALVSRLDAYTDTLHRIEDHLLRLNGRVLAVEKWQAGTDPVLESLNERVEINSVRSEENTTYINQQKGGAAMRLQIISLAVSILSIISLTLKMLFWHPGT